MRKTQCFSTINQCNKQKPTVTNIKPEPVAYMKFCFEYVNTLISAVAGALPGHGLFWLSRKEVWVGDQSIQDQIVPCFDYQQVYSDSEKEAEQNAISALQERQNRRDTAYMWDTYNMNTVVFHFC